MSSPKALARTADRHRSTGELHQALDLLLPDDGSVLTIPPARYEEQARLEAEVFLGLGGVGGLTAHPLGIVRLRPEPDGLTARVADAPYVVMCWADLLLHASAANTMVIPATASRASPASATAATPAAFTGTTSAGAAAAEPDGHWMLAMQRSEVLASPIESPSDLVVQLGIHVDRGLLPLGLFTLQVVPRLCESPDEAKGRLSQQS